MAFAGSQFVDVSHGVFNDVAGDQYSSNRITLGLNDSGRYPMNILSRLTALGAAYDSFEREPVPRCLTGTYTDVLANIFEWIRDPGDRRIFWLNGSAGVGKTALAQTIAEYCAETSRLGASFFCYRGNEERSDGHRIFPTIAFQLATETVPPSYLPISDALAYMLSVSDYQNFQGQFQLLIVKPLLNLAEPLSAPVVIVIDALDECEDMVLMGNIISLFATALGDRMIPLQLFVTSRPEPHIEEIFQEFHIESQTRSLSLDKVDVRGSVRDYLQHSLNDIWWRRGIRDHILSQNFVDALVNLADGSFIYASTALRFIGEEESFLSERLNGREGHG